jgi:aldose sugar dehydrogenase
MIATTLIAWRRVAAILSFLALTACDSTPAPPAVEPGTTETITGSERLGWNQAAADAVELGTFRYTVYIDGQRFELTGASCGRSRPDADFSCSAPFPRMSRGPHTLEIATFIVDGTALESSRSAPIQITFVGGNSLAGSQPSPDMAREGAIVTADGVRLTVTQMLNGLVDPVDLAFMPDGRMLIAEREGRLRIVRDGRLLPAPAWSLSSRHSDQEQLLAVAVDPDFDRSHLVHVIYTTTSARGDLVFCLARLRETADTLGDRIVLFDDVPASPNRASASLRFGPDGKLFAAFDDGGTPRRAGDLSSPNGKVLRLNPDGTTPDDQAANSPMYSWGYRSPRGLGWHLPAGTLWIATQQGESGLLYGLANDGTRRRGFVRAAFTLPAGTVPSAVAVYPNTGQAMLRGDVLIASDEGRHLLRLRDDPGEPTRIVATERLLQDRIGGVRAVAVGPDGAIYVGTARAIWRLSPTGSG